MIFNSIEFFVFLAISLPIFWALPERNRKYFVLLASMVFYGWWDWRFLSLILGSSVLDFFVSHRVAAAPTQPQALRWLRLSLLGNLGTLAVFKYLGFFVDSAQAALDRIGLPTDPLLLQITLPVGISFYTFQTLSYTIDVYRGDTKPASNLFEFAAFVSFFPQLVAGPIERSNHLLPQFNNPNRSLNWNAAASGLGLIIFGLFQKVAVGDAVAPLTNAAFNAPSSFSGLSLAAATLGFAIQIYGDFAGYSNIARGTARLFGFELKHNFREPYLSRSITEFWRRWHISLSDWLRDYLYIPLGGNRGGSLMTYRNLAATMLLGGLWHGASWNFVIWGGLHGLFLAVERLAGVRVAKGPVRPFDVLAIVRTQLLVGFAWIFFRADSFSTSSEIVSRIVRFASGTNLTPDELSVLAYAAIATLVGDLLLRRRLLGERVEHKAMMAGGVAAMCALLIVAFSGGEQQPFIYFQF